MRSACDSEQPTTVTHGRPWSLGGCQVRSGQSGFALVRTLGTSPKQVVRGGVEPPTFRFSSRECSPQACSVRGPDVDQVQCRLPIWAGDTRRDPPPPEP